MCNNHCGDVAFHQERHCRTARTSPRHSFLPISCGFPTDVTIPNVPPQLKQILSVCSLREKCWLTAQRRAHLSAGTAAQHRASLGAKWCGTRPLHTSSLPKTTRLKSMLHRTNSANQLLCTPLTQGRVVLYWNIYQYRCRMMTTRIASGFFQGWPHRQRPPSQTKSRPEIGQKPLISEKPLRLVN